MQSIIRWAGSKKQILNTLKLYWSPGFKRYLEPFAGSAALFFKIEPEKALLGDLNAELIEMYSEVKTNYELVYSYLVKFKNSKKDYYDVRAMALDSLSSAERAARFIYLNRYCFNGLFRTNLSGNFNVPYGGEKSGSLPTIDILKECSISFQNVQLIVGDFSKILRRAKEGDFVYIDPPYALEKQRSFTEYGAKSFKTNDLTRLKKHLIRLDSDGAKFVMSYSDRKFIREQFCNWEIKRVKVRRNIAGFNSARKSAYEIIVTNIY